MTGEAPKRPPTPAALDLYRRIDRLVDEAEELPEAERPPYLDRACAGDERLRSGVARLLAAESSPRGLLSATALEDLASDLAAVPAAPPVLAGYRVIAPLGSGGMGDVFLAQDLRLGRQVALKVLPRAFAGDPDRMRRFEREARTVSSLNHPNILTLHDIVGEESTPCLVLEYVEGETLRDRLERGRLPPLEAVRVATQIAAALKAAHAAGVVHRDIKPANVMLRRDGLVKVLDFGLAKVVARTDGQAPAVLDDRSAASEISAPGAVLGTPSYMSPEQAAARPTDARSDLYSLGAVLNEMVADRPVELARMIERLLRPDPGERYGDAAQLRRELEALRLVLEASLARPGEGVSVAAARRKRGRRAVTVATSVALAVALLFLGGSWLAGRRERSPAGGAALDRRDTILVGEFDNATQDPMFDSILKQALAVYLEQSPYLSLFPDQGVEETLGYMNLRALAERPLRPEVLREICQRNGIKALVGGRIVKLGAGYVVSLDAVAVASGEGLARGLAEAASKEEVLRALRDAASQLRLRLGESLASVRAYDVPLEKATTSSLEALRDYALGRRQLNRGLTAEAIPLFLEAVRRDPSFASAHAHLAAAYRSQGNIVLDREYAARAYALRERASAREALLIEQQYLNYVLGDLDRAVETLRRWRLTYPHDHAPASLLGSPLLVLGRYQESMEESRAALAVYPDDAGALTDLGLALAVAGNAAEARGVLERAEARGLAMRRLRHALDPESWLRTDPTGSVDLGGGPGAEALALNRAAVAARDRGQASDADALGRRAIAAARRVDAGLAGRYAFESALRAASLARCAESEAAARTALALSDHPWALSGVALARALCGRDREAREVLAALLAGHPHDTLVQRAARPTTLALFAAGAGRFDEALDLLAGAKPYEMGTYAALWPVYVRGLVLLRAGRHREAVPEFERVIDFDRLRVGHPFTPSSSMARLHLARSLVSTGDTARARQVYDELLVRWQRADPGLAGLDEARVERARLTDSR